MLMLDISALQLEFRNVRIRANVAGLLGKNILDN